MTIRKENSRQIDLKYHIKQYRNPYETTKQITSFLNKKINLKFKNFLDLGSGSGANLFYLKKKFKIADSFGVDNQPTLIKLAKKMMKNKKIKNIRFYLGNIEKLNKSANILKNKIDVVTILQVLSILDGYKKVINSAIKFNPKFIAVSSLFWDGYLDFKIRVDFLKKNKGGIVTSRYYNIYSIYKYLEYMKSKGYKKNYVKKLKFMKNLKLKDKKIMGSYTSNLNGKKVLITGPLIQSWYFIISKK